MSIGIAAGSAMLASMPAKSAFAGELTFTASGGAGQAAQRRAMLEPYSNEKGTKITEEEYSGGAAKIRAMVGSKTVSWDVVVADETTSMHMCNDGLLETIDWKKLGFDQSKFMDGVKNECAVPMDHYSTVFAYDKDRLPNGPKTIAEFFDLKKFPGKRGLNRAPMTTLEYALMADGVAPKDVYTVLRTPAGIDRAFKKLDTIKKDTIWWQAGAQPAQLLADAQAAITAIWSGRVYDAIKNSGKNFGIVWDAQQIGTNVYVIPKGAPHLNEAYRFIAFAASPKSQANFANIINSGPANRDALRLVNPEMLPYQPNAPEHMNNALVLDSAFWGEKSGELIERFNGWLAR